MKPACPYLCLSILASLPLVAVWACAGPGSSAPSEAGEPSFYLGGIQVDEPDSGHWLDALEAAGMNTVAVTDYARQGDWDGDDLWWDEASEGALEEIRAAKARGFGVILVLRVALDHAFERNRFLWHGMIQPESEEALASWFEKYGRFARHWAEVAEREGVDVVMIASEMNALASTVPLDEVPALEEYYLNEDKQTARREELLRHAGAIEESHLWLRDRESYPDLESYLEARIASERAWAEKVAAEGREASLEKLNRRRALLDGHWRALIEDLRGVYGGRLGYAANFDQYRDVGFWDELDVMGINAYFKLRHRLLAEDDRDALYRELVAGWRGVLGEIASFRAEQGLGDLPVVFTEIGYTYRENSTLEPWADTGFSLIPTADGETEKLVVWQEQPFDLEERALAVRALHEAHARLDDPFLQGLLYWKLSTNPDHRDVEAFLLVLGEPDPLVAELRRFVEEPAKSRS